MKGYSAQQVRAAEAPHLAAGEPLMARAAAALADRCERVLMDSGVNPAHARVVVLVGAGNNGGDALFAAAILAGRRMSVEIVPVADRAHAEGLEAALAAGALIADAAPAKVAASARSADLVVDGILGTGTSPDPRLRGAAREVVAAIAAEHLLGKVVAADIPSGIHPDTGEVPEPGAVLRADVTVTFGGAKAGLLRSPGRDFAGDIRIADIGLGLDLEKLVPLIDA
jgi:hydroxyethylthiazole kinase-like uncharacterized protein yjeF